MKKLLFISNCGSGRLDSFSNSSRIAAKELEIEFHTASNYANKEILKEESEKYGVYMHQIDFKRNPCHPANFKAYKQLKKLMEEEKFDIVHCNTPVGGVLGRLCAKKTKIPYVIYMAHGFHFYKGAPLLNRILYKNVEKWLAHYTDVLVTINEEDYKAAQKFHLRNNGQVAIVHGVGIETDNYKIENFDRESYRKQLGLKPDDIMIISAGELSKGKNYETSIKAIAECKNEKLHYYICGRGKRKEKLEKLIQKLHLEKQIHLLGFRTDIKELMNSADIFLFTTLREGLSRALMEAMASGLPCVVSKIRGNVDLIQDEKGGVLCNPTNYKEFSEAIKYLSKDSHKRLELGHNNILNVKNYNVNKVTEEIIKIYKEK